MYGRRNIARVLYFVLHTRRCYSYRCVLVKYHIDIGVCVQPSFEWNSQRTLFEWRTRAFVVYCCRRQNVMCHSCVDRNEIPGVCIFCVGLSTGYLSIFGVPKCEKVKKKNPTKRYAKKKKKWKNPKWKITTATRWCTRAASVNTFGVYVSPVNQKNVHRRQRYTYPEKGDGNALKIILCNSLSLSLSLPLFHTHTHLH